MYLQYFGFKDDPFSVTPDPAFLFLGTPHREALGHLLYGAGEHGGFVQLSGEVGTGKTTLIRALLDNRMPRLDVALCWHPQLDVREFVATICDELGVSGDSTRDSTSIQGRDVSLKALVDRLNAHLLKSHAAGRRTLLIIDEAQNLNRDVLEQLRLLTNLETSKHKLLRIILVGQPEMDTFLARHDLRQLSQRISARFKLTSLDRFETSDYINHRLTCVGSSGRLFSPAARRLIYWYTRGTPRLINLVCERALMGAYAQGRATIGPLIVRQAARETLPRRSTARRNRRFLWPAVATACVVLALTLAAIPSAHFGPLLSWATASDGGIVSDADAAPVTATHAAEPQHDESQAQRHPADRPVDAHAADATAPGSTSNGRQKDRAANAAAAHEMPKITAKPLLLSELDAPGSKLQPIQLAAATGSDDQARKKKAGTEGGVQNATIVLPQGPATPLPEGNAQLSQLLRLWGVFGAKIKADCGNLRVGDLRCMAGKATLEQLAHFNRPAILYLNQDGHARRLLISQLDKNSATLTGAEGTRRIDRERLEQLWNGKFLMIWRADAQVTYIHSHMIGHAVAWLRSRLAKAPDQDKPSPIGPESPIFDARLEGRVRHFQLMHGLKPDGIVGPRTQIVLNSIDPPAGTPTLEPEPSEKG